MKDFAFLFPGQGSQAVGMGKGLYEKSDFGKKIFKMADETLGYPLSKICFAGPEEELKLTYNAQPALLTVSYILFHLLEREPAIAAGHSLGEYSALCCAGAINFEDAVKVVHKRGKYMQEAVPPDRRGVMVALYGIEIDEVKRLISQVDGIVNIANWNSSTQIVISGEKEAVDQVLVKTFASNSGYLPVSAPFHSQLMRPAEEKLAADLDRIQFRDLRFPVINNVEAKEMTTGNEAREALKRQVTRPVLWHSTILSFLGNKKIKKFAEIGSNKILAKMLKRTGKDMRVEFDILNIQDIDDIKQAAILN
ncbi:MAG: ACP S-malonyltransferase [Candidatus Aminicenantes bacterium]|nr:MAG: ACP S-malonyltransferase [Candidatus Aminicenantes bacterium]